MYVRVLLAEKQPELSALLFSAVRVCPVCGRLLPRIPVAVA